MIAPEPPGLESSRSHPHLTAGCKTPVVEHNLAARGNHDLCDGVITLLGSGVVSNTDKRAGDPHVRLGLERILQWSSQTRCNRGHRKQGNGR